VNFKSSESASKFYPSVDCGPIDITKAQAFLGWNPTPLVKAIAKIISTLQNFLIFMKSFYFFFF